MVVSRGDSNTRFSHSVYTAQTTAQKARKPPYPKHDTAGLNRYSACVINGAVGVDNRRYDGVVERDRHGGVLRTSGALPLAALIWESLSVARGECVCMCVCVCVISTDRWGKANKLGCMPRRPESL